MKSAMCNVQRVIVVEKDIMSIAKLAKSGESTPHALQTAHADIAWGGGYLYVHIFI